jgi:cytochrome c553
MKTLMTTCCAVMAILCLTATAGAAADPENGRKLARKCSVCHGKIGLARGDPEVPNLAGQPALYLEKSLKDYRSGTREDRRMTLLAKKLTDPEIKDLAAWFSSIEITAAAPPD